jgi:hypothetical protein
MSLYSFSALLLSCALRQYPEGEYHAEGSNANASSVSQPSSPRGHVNSNIVAHQGIAQASANVVAVAPTGPPVTSSIATNAVTQDDSQAIINFMTPEWIAFFQSPEFSEWCAHGMPADVCSLPPLHFHPPVCSDDHHNFCLFRAECSPSPPLPSEPLRRVPSTPSASRLRT